MHLLKSHTPRAFSFGPVKATVTGTATVLGNAMVHHTTLGF
jgi:hypothetical protein